MSSSLSHQQGQPGPSCSAKPPDFVHERSFSRDFSQLRPLGTEVNSSTVQRASHSSTTWTPLLNAKALREAKEKGSLDTTDHGLYEMAYPAIVTEHLSLNLLMGLHRRCFAPFYRDPTKWFPS